ncbi:MAG TPA: electron transport complex subunit RsxD [Pseudomonadales bacterium]
MALLRVTSPHAHHPMNKTGWVMLQVLFALLPGIATITWFFGWGTIVNIVWASVLAVSLEAIVLKLRKRSLRFYLGDFSALVTAWLLAIALPPYAPWWLVTVGIAFAILIAKHLYGGMGYNPFNPAMVGYVVLLISFPLQMTTWAEPRGVAGADLPNFLQALQLNFGLVDRTVLDGITGATALDLFAQNKTLQVSELWLNPIYGAIGGHGQEWINAAFLLGGLVLLARRIFTWHAPVCFLLALTLAAAAGYDSGSAASGGSPLMHLFTGATMLGAFFIVTDPVTSAVSNRGRMIYGACIGVLVYSIRHWGNYPDAVAFSVLLMNFAAPLIDNYTQPRTYGHKPVEKSS